MTPEQRQSAEQALAEATATSPHKSDFADKLGISRQAFFQWDVVPPHRVLEVERLTGVPRFKLRPDYYPAPRGKSATAWRDHLKSVIDCGVDAERVASNLGWDPLEIKTWLRSDEKPPMAQYLAFFQEVSIGLDEGRYVYLTDKTDWGIGEKAFGAEVPFVGQTVHLYIGDERGRQATYGDGPYPATVMYVMDRAIDRTSVLVATPKLSERKDAYYGSAVYRREARTDLAKGEPFFNYFVHIRR